MSMRTYGITTTEDGSFLMASLVKTAPGWKVKKLCRWNADNAIKNLLLFHRGVVAVAPSHWDFVKSASPKSSENFIDAPSQGEMYPRTNATALTAYTGRLEDNLVAVVPDNAFLCSIPLAFGGSSAGSFVSVYRTEPYYKIGVTVNATLVAVFNMAPAAPQSLAGHLGRLERYWADTHHGGQLPENRYLLGDFEAPIDIEKTSVRLGPAIKGFDINDKDAVSAVGAALIGPCGNAPRFPVDADAALFRKVRAGMYAFSACLVLCALALVATVPVSAFIARQKLAAYKKQYQTILSNNPEIQKLMSQNDSLARATLSAYNAASKQTRWAQFFQELGTVRPQGLFLEMLGADGQAASGKVRIALSGWALNESQVTGFISSLQNNSMFSGVSISSIERNATSNIFTFRIACTLKLSAGSAAK
jgi:Tfp pilus assembly protein PilN